MMNYNKSILAAAINDILNLGQEFLEELIEIPPQKELGDFSLPCFKLINKSLTNPFMIAKEIKKEFNSDIFERVEIHGVYLNFYLNKSVFMNSTIDNILLNGDKLGKSYIGSEKVIYIEDSFSVMTEGVGERINFSEVIKRSLYNIFKSQSYNVYDSCDFDYIDKDFLKNITDDLMKKEQIKYKNCAKVIELKDYNMMPFIAENIFGEVSKEAKVLGKLIYIKKFYDFNRYMIIGRKDKKISFNQLAKASQVLKIDLDEDSLEYIPLGMVRFEKYKDYSFIDIDSFLNEFKRNMKKNLHYANSLWNYEDRIEEKVLEEAVVFSYLKSPREKDKNISLNDIMSFHDESYLYVQHSYITALNILDKSKDIEFNCLMKGPIETSSWELAEILGEFHKKILEAINLLEPYVITQYIIDITQKFNKFILTIEGENPLYEPYQIKLIKAYKVVFNNAMKLIGVQTIDEI